MNKKIIYKILFIFLFTIIICFVFNSKVYAMTVEEAEQISKELLNKSKNYRIRVRQEGSPDYVRDGNASFGNEADINIYKPEEGMPAVEYIPGKQITIEIIYRTNEVTYKKTDIQFRDIKTCDGDVWEYTEPGSSSAASKKDVMFTTIKYTPSSVSFDDDSKNYSDVIRNIWVKLDPDIKEARVSVNFDIFFKTKDPNYLAYAKLCEDDKTWTSVTVEDYTDFDDEYKMLKERGPGILIDEGEVSNKTDSEYRCIYLY